MLKYEIREIKIDLEKKTNKGKEKQLLK